MRKIAIIVEKTNELYFEECLKRIDMQTFSEDFSAECYSVEDSLDLSRDIHEIATSESADYVAYISDRVFLANERVIESVISSLEDDKKHVAGIRSVAKDGPYSSWGFNFLYDGKRTDLKGKPGINGILVAKVEELEPDMVVFRTDLLSKGITIEKILSDFADREFEFLAVSIDAPSAYINLKSSSDEQIIGFKKGLMRVVGSNFPQALDDFYNSDPTDKFDFDTWELRTVSEAYHWEKLRNDKKQSSLFGYDNYEEFLQLYTYIRLQLLNEALFGEAVSEEVGEAIANGDLTTDFLRSILYHSVPDCEELIEKYITSNFKDETILISFIISVYNGEGFVDKTIDSILKQEYKNFELIIVDDASKDGSKAVIDRYSDKRIIKKYLDTNLNVCNAVNEGYKLATGKYICLVGHDDYVGKTRIRQQLLFMEEHEKCTLSFTEASYIDDDGNVCLAGKPDLFRALNRSSDSWWRNMFDGRNNFCASSSMIRKSSLKDERLYCMSTVQLQDFELWLRLLLKGEAYAINKEYTAYRVGRSENTAHLSTASEGTYKRVNVEGSLVRLHNIMKLSDEDFLRIFKDRVIFKYEGELTHKEVYCLKIHFLWYAFGPYAYPLMYEAMDDDELREIFQSRFDYSLQNFYKDETTIA